MKLGRKAVKTDTRTVRLARYLTPGLPEPPKAVDWTKGIKDFGTLLNDQLGDCTIAGVAHAIQIWSANTGTEASITDDVVEHYYSAWDGYNPNDPSTDQGGVELDVLTNWKNQSFAGHKLLAFASADASNLDEIVAATNLFGGVYIGMNVPNFVMQSPDPGTIWDVVADDGGIDGGHCVFVPGYSQPDGTVPFISWGEVYTMTMNFWRKYVDEAYALIGQDWIGAQGTAPSGLNLNQLLADVAQIR